jgi:hypothetical protein
MVLLYLAILPSFNNGLNKLKYQSQNQLKQSLLKRKKGNKHQQFQLNNNSR